MNANLDRPRTCLGKPTSRRVGLRSSRRAEAEKPTRLLRKIYLNFKEYNANITFSSMSELLTNIMCLKLNHEQVKSSVPYGLENCYQVSRLMPPEFKSRVLSSP